MEFSNTHRSKFVKRASAEAFDLLVIGGGITGCGIALDAALRGLSVLLLEKSDFASGTSSRSTKLIHGGLRYLKQLELKLVHDVGHERSYVYHNAMHLVKPQAMLLPIVENGTLGKQSVSLALWMYDMLAGVRSAERKKMLSRHETLHLEPLLNHSVVRGGGLYYEYSTDDARLVIELAKSAQRAGATCLNYVQVKSLQHNDAGKVCGATVWDATTQKEFSVRAKKVVNASGPWVDDLRQLDEAGFQKTLLLTKGVHLVVSQKHFPLKQSVYFDVPDGRMIFAIPRARCVYIGTTDTFYEGDREHPRVTKADVQYLLDAVNRMFPTIALSEKHIISSWAGLRSLIFEEGKSASELSRKDEVKISASGLYSIAGGKLTGYRLMAKKIVDAVCKELSRDEDRKLGGCGTEQHKLSGCEFEDEEHMQNYLGILKESFSDEPRVLPYIQKWFYRYGANTAKVAEAAIALQGAVEDDILLSLIAELIYCTEYEMVYSVEDFITRRTSMLYFERERSLEYLEQLHEYLCRNLKYPALTAETLLQQTETRLQEAVSFV